MKESRRIGVTLVNAIERKPIVSYFTGMTDNSDQIDIQMRSQTLLSRNELKMGGKVGGSHPGSKLLPDDAKAMQSKGYSSKG